MSIFETLLTIDMFITQLSRILDLYSSLRRWSLIQSQSQQRGSRTSAHNAATTMPHLSSVYKLPCFFEPNIPYRIMLKKLNKINLKNIKNDNLICYPSLIRFITWSLMIVTTKHELECDWSHYNKKCSPLLNKVVVRVSYFLFCLCFYLCFLTFSHGLLSVLLINTEDQISRTQEFFILSIWRNPK